MINSAENIEVLKNLDQQSAAYLVGLSPRTLRDHPEIPRAPDGSYDARQLVEWDKTRLEVAEIDDALWERILMLIDQRLIREPFSTPFGILNDLNIKYGDAGLVAFGRELLRQYRGMYEAFEDDCDLPTSEDIDRERQRAVKALRESVSEDRLEIVLVCQWCKAWRQGRTWYSGEPPYPKVLHACCPDCKAKGKPD